MGKVYLRIVEILQGQTSHKSIDLFEGDIAEDKKYWQKYQGATSVRYFKLEEVI